MQDCVRLTLFHFLQQATRFQCGLRNVSLSHVPHELRWALIEASWTAIQFSGYFGALYRNARTRGKNKHVAITMVAHRMAKIIWLLLKEKRPYTETLPDRSEDQVTVAPRRK